MTLPPKSQSNISSKHNQSLSFVSMEIKWLDRQVLTKKDCWKNVELCCKWAKTKIYQRINGVPLELNLKHTIRKSNELNDLNLLFYLCINRFVEKQQLNHFNDDLFLIIEKIYKKNHFKTGSKQWQLQYKFLDNF